MRAGALARIAHGTNHFAPYHFAPHFRVIIAEMGVHGLIAEAVVDDNRLAIPRLPADFYDFTVSLAYTSVPMEAEKSIPAWNLVVP